MKKNKLLVLTILVGILLTSCSSVFDASINGKVVDDESGNGIENMAVYAYDSESARDAAYNRYNSQEDKSVFVDSSVPSARTDANGNFSIPTIRWKTNSPSFGKDGDTTTVYLLFFNEEYGMNKSNEGYVVYSAKTNQIGNTFSFESIWETKTVNLRMLDGAFDSNNSITDVIEYTVTYNDGNEEVVLHQNTNAFTVRYKIGSNPSVTISNINTNPADKTDPLWYRTKDKGDGTIVEDNFTFDITSENTQDTIYQIIYFKKAKMVFPGISGYYYTGSTGTEQNIGIVKDDGILLSLFFSSDTENENPFGSSVNTQMEVIGAGADKVINHGYFTGLGSGGELKLSYTGVNENKFTSDKVKVQIVDTSASSNVVEEIEITNKTTVAELTNLMFEKTE